MTARPASPPHANADPAAPAAPAAPARLLVLGGSIGGGHTAAAEAVAEAATARWPGVEVVRADTLAGMGPGAPRVFAGIYTFCLRHAGWLYALYFRLLTRVGFFRAGTRAVIGAWSGRGVARTVAAHRPDVVVATFPEGVTGLAWLRRHGRLPLPALGGPRLVAVLADPAPHPLWCDPVLDAHLVASDAAAAALRRLAPGAAVTVTVPPVVTAFTPPAPRPARDRPRVYVAAGSLALGGLPAVCGAALDAGADVVVGCGRVPAVGRRLRRWAAGRPDGDALEVRDWIDDPAATVRDADVVVTTGAGASTFEALAARRHVVVADPVPGHGVANAALLAGAGLARRASGPAVAAAVRAAVTDARRGPAPAPGGVDLGAGLAGAGALVRTDPAPAGRVRAADALFLHTATATAPQQVGARVVVEDVAADGWPGHLEALVRARAAGIELLGRRLAPPRRGRALRWVRGGGPDAGAHVWPDVVDGRADGGDAAAAAFFAAPVDPVRLGWELAAVRSGPREVSVLAKVHHALGDGLAVTDALTRLLTDEGATLPVLEAAARTGAAPHRAAAARRIARGLVSLAATGPAGAHPLVGAGTGPGFARHVAEWDGARLRATARAHGVSTTALALGLLAEALSEALSEALTPGTHPRGGPAVPPVRVMVPLTTRLRPATGVGAAGNRTAAVSLTLPLDPMPVADRVAATARALRAATGDGQAEAAAWVLGLLAATPRPLARRLARVAYGRRFLHVLASVMPGVRRPLHCRGGLIRTVAPVLPPVDGIGLAVGFLAWGRTVGVGITADPAILDAADLPDRLGRALDAAAPRAGNAGEAEDGTRRRGGARGGPG